jgi:hypothetical protein
MSDAEPRGHREHRWIKIGAVAPIVAAVVGAIIAGVFLLLGSGGTSAVTSNGSTSGQSACNGATISGSHNSFNCAPSVSSTASSAGLSSDPRARIVQITGSWSEQGFVDAIVDRETRIVALYLKTGMKATTSHEGASAILWAFQGARQNGDPIALVKTFQADGFKVDDQLEDSYLMQKLTDGNFPLPFNTDLTPKGYTGGYQGGTFVGSLLFWIVQRASWAGPTGEDLRAIEYLIGQGARCAVPLSFLEFNRGSLAGTSPYAKLLPLMQRCSRGRKGNAR